MGDFANKYGNVQGDDRPESFASKYSNFKLDTPPEQSVFRRVGDVGLDFFNGIVDTGESAVGFADLATGNLVGTGLAKLGYDPTRTREILDSGYSEARKHENADVAAANGFLDTVIANVKNPAVALGTIIESSPMMLESALAVRKVATDMVVKAGLKVGAKADAAAISELLSSPAAKTKLAAVGSGSEGMMQAGSNQEQGRQAGRTYGETAPYSIASGVGDALIGTFTSNIPGMSDIERSAGTLGLVKSALPAGKRIAQGAAQEGLEETAQSGQEQAFQNISLGKPLGEGVTSAMATGMIAGAGMGGAVRAIEGRSPIKAAENIIAQPTVDDAIAAATAELATGRRVPFDTTPVTTETESRIPGIEIPSAGGSLDELQAMQNADVNIPTLTDKLDIPTVTDQLSPQQAEEVKSGRLMPFDSGSAQITTSKLEPTSKEEPGSQIPAAELKPEPKFSLVEKGQEKPVVQPPQVLLKNDGTPFSNEKVAKMSGKFKQNPGATVVPVGAGFGIQLAPVNPTQEPAAVALGENTAQALESLDSAVGGKSAVPFAKTTQAAGAEPVATVNTSAERVDETQRNVREQKRGADGFTADERFKVITGLARSATSLADLRADVADRLGGEIAKANDHNTKAAWNQKVQTERRKVGKDDSLLVAIAKLGGISMDYRQDVTGDTKAKMTQAGQVFTKTGAHPVDMVKKLKVEGYFTQPEIESTADNDGTNLLADRVRRELAGKKHYQLDSTKALEEATERHYEEQIESMKVQRESEYDRIAQEHGQDAADQTREFDDYMLAFTDHKDDVINKLEQEAFNVYEEDSRFQGTSQAEDSTDNQQSGQTPDSQVSASGQKDSGTESKPVTPFSLKQQTPEEIAQQERQRLADENTKQEAEAKTKADAELPGFTLAGSNSKVDQAEARGQNNLFGANPERASLPLPEVSELPVEEVAPAPAVQPAIVTATRAAYIKQMIKAAGIKKSSPGYEDAVSRIENDYETELDKAYAAMPFEQYNELNKETPESLNRQAYDQLQKQYGDNQPVTAPMAEEIPKTPAAEADKTPLQFVTDTITAMFDGNLKLADFNAAFQSLKDNVPAIKEELEGMTKQAILDRMNPNSAYRYKSEKKDLVIREYIDDLMDEFIAPASDGTGLSYVVSGQGDYQANKMAAIEKKIATVTQQSLDDFATNIAERRSANKQKRDDAMKGMENPQTLDDYKRLVNKLAEENKLKTFKEARALLPIDQRIAFDKLAAADTRGKRTFDRNSQKTRLSTSSQMVEGQIVETKHTKKGTPLFVVQLGERVSKEDYQNLNNSAKKLGGYYSSFRGAGAVPGFTFTERSQAEAFNKLAAGDTGQAQEVVQSRRDAFVDDKSQSSVERLRDMASTLEDRGNEKLNQDRKVNTSRRAGMAARAEAQASAQVAMAKTMNNIANAIESGRANMLDQVRTKAQIEMLDGFVTVAKNEEARKKFPDNYGKQQDFGYSKPTADTAEMAEFPQYVAWRSDLASLSRQLQDKDGTRLLGNKLAKLADDVTAQYEKWAKANLHRISTFLLKDGTRAAFPTNKAALEAIYKSGYNGQAIPLQIAKGEHAIVLSPSEAQKRGLWEGQKDTKVTLSPDFAEELVTKLSRRSVDVPWILATSYEKRKRLASMNIETPAEFRVAIQEYVSLLQNPEPADKVKQLERSMVGRAKDGLDFFPTPAAQADEMIETADIKEGMDVLEPSAGMGHIADQLRQAGHEPDVIELSGNRRELLEAKGYNLVGSDFMEFNDKKYDRIIMNPPFSDRRDFQHVQHAYSLLKPDGRLVAIVGEGVFFGSDKKAQAFRDWMKAVGGTDEKLAEGTFNDPSLPVNTSVNARMIVIDKSAAGEVLASQDQPERWLTAEPGTKGMTVDAVKSSIADAVAKLNQQLGVDVIVLNNTSEVPAIEQGARYQGAYHNGKVYLFADNLQSARKAQVTLAHELVGHKGILEAVTPEEWADIKTMIAGLINGGNKHATSIMQEVTRRYGKANEEVWYKEFLALAAERRELRSGFKDLWARVKLAITNFLKSVGLKGPFGESELEGIMANSERYLQESGAEQQIGDEALASESLEAFYANETKGWLARNGYRAAILENGNVRLYTVDAFGEAGDRHYPTLDAAKRAGSDPRAVEVNPATLTPAGRVLVPRGSAGQDLFSNDVPRRQSLDDDGVSVEHSQNANQTMSMRETKKTAETAVLSGLPRRQNAGVEARESDDSRSAQEGQLPIGFKYLSEEGRIRSRPMRDLPESQSSNAPSRLQQPQAGDMDVPPMPSSIASGNDGLSGKTEGFGNASIAVSRREAVEAGLPLFSKEAPPSEFEEENRRLREEDKTLWVRAKKLLRQQFAPGGLLPEAVFSEKLKRDFQFEAAEFDVRHLVGELENTIKKEYGVQTNKLSEADQNALSEALAGRIPDSVKPETKTVLVAMRQYIDHLSSEYMSILQKQANDLVSQAEAAGDTSAIADANERLALMNVIAGNQGKYVHRSYQAFDDANWFKRVPEATVDAARRYLIAQHTAKGETPQEARRLAEVALHEILKNGTAYGGFEAFIKESKLGAKDLSVLKKRQDIAPEIRALLGEYTDPRLNFAKTATKMARLVWNQRFLDKVQLAGMGTFFFEGTDRPPAATVQIAADGSEVYSPLNGLWTFPEVDQAFKDALGKEKMANWYKAIIQMNGLVKVSKTILSPTTAARNWQSAMFFSLANGHFDLTQVTKSIAGLREYFNHAGEGAKLAYLRELKELGVVYDTPYAGEMMRLLDDSQVENMLTGSTMSLAGKKAFGFAQRFYQYGDDFWKIIGFENEKNMLIKHAGMSESEAKKEAAERIRNTYPTYSLVGKGIQSLRRFPLVGSFVSFPAEIIRTTFNMLNYVKKDMADPKMRPLAIRRALGMTFAAGFAFALQAMTKAMFDIDDDDEEAIRLQAAPWQKNSNLVFTGRDEKGNIRYIDISFLDPYNYWKRPLNAIMRGQPWQETTSQVAKEVLQPFLGTDILAGTLFDILANKKESGGQVYKKTDDPDRQLVDIANYLRKSVQPGIISNLERTAMALEGKVSSSGQKYDIGDELKGWVGWRATTLDPKTALYYSSFEFNDAKSEASKTLTQVLTNPNDVDNQDIAEAYRLSLRMRGTAYQDMEKLVNASRRSGMGNMQIMVTLKGAGLSQADINALLHGVTPAWTPTKQAEQMAVKRAEAILGPEKAKEIRSRYQAARRMPVAQ